MDNSFDLNNTNNDNSMTMDEDKGETYVLTRKVDEVTGSQMKEIEVQKMEDDYTIKMLERKYIETKRNLLYTKRKVEEARNKGAEQTETMNQLLEANKAIVEKFDELKRYQTGSLLDSLNNAEKTYYNWKDKYAEFSNILQMILEKENYSIRLNEGVSKRKNELNIEIQRQIAQRKKAINDLNEALAQSDHKNKILQKQLNLETFDNNLKNIIDEKSKRVIQLEADHESYQRLFKQEVDNLLQMKNSQIQELQNINTNLELKKEALSKLQLEVSSIAKSQSKQNQVLLNLKAKKDAILQEVTRSRQISDMTKKSFDENVTNIMNDQEKMNAELQAAEKNFVTTEESLQKEFGTLRTAYDEKKKMLKKLETSEEDLKQFRSMKSTKLKELDANCKEKEGEVIKIAEDYAKLEQMESAYIQKQSNLDAKIKELQEKINSIQKELNAVEKDENDATTSGVNTRKEKSKPMFQNENKTVDSTGKADSDSNKDDKKKGIKSLTPEKNVLKSWFESDDSEESEDEFKIQNIIPKISNSATAAQKKPVYDRDLDAQSIDSTNDDNRSQSDKLFDELFAQKSTVTSKNEVILNSLMYGPTILKIVRERGANLNAEL
ncbi:uncharacterized protein PFB0765w isoform X1 [Nasonia vitripennis]|uniref:Uncharacterized protein n=1 Tax=Nasonia vitripennis TaxID=7425 RepID=A0A7M7Q459_NASVI|nr:uncharacterized protein PFB0765w isoform X1 [Nasonia vitripennis]XP_031780008.1 uncharacterized protein PFB0765w isoform X1 [Nasonia vitripennis]